MGSDNDMIDKIDLKKFGPFADFVRKTPVRLARLGFAAGVVVHKNEGIRCINNCWAKNLARMGGAFVETTNGHDMVGFWPKFCVEQDGYEVLFIRFEIGL